MIVTCPNCETKYNLPEDRIPAGGTKVKCSRCSHIFKAEPPASMPEEEVENLLDQEPEVGAEAAAPDTDDEFDKAFNEVAGQGEAPDDEPAPQEQPAEEPGGEAAAETEEPAEHGGDVFADDDMPADDDFDSLFDEPVGSADEVSPDDFASEDDEQPAEQPAEEPEAPAASAPEDDLGDLFGDDEPAEAPAPGGAQAPPEDDDYADLFGDDDEPEAEEEPAEAPAEGDDLEGGLFDEEPEEGDLFEQKGESDDSEEEPAEGPFETDFDLDESEAERQPGGKGKWVAMVVIFLIAAGLAAGWYFKAWKFFGIDPASLLADVPVIGSMFDEGEAEAPLSPEEKIKNIELKNVRQYYVQNEKAGLVFVVQGEAVNAFDTPRERIEVEVFLYDANGNVLTSQRVMGGNTLSMFQLRVQSKQEIEEGLASEVGILSNNTFLRPGASTPFMAAIFEPPTDKVKEFGVKVVDVQKPE